MRPILIVSFAASLALVNEADASTCERVKNQLGPCDVLPASQCNGTLTPQQIITWNNWMYADDQHSACKKYWQSSIGFEGLTLAYPVASGFPDTWNCTYDDNDNGVISAFEKSANNTTVFVEEVTRDTCCDLVPQGPYEALFASVGPPPTSPDGSFLSTQISAIKALNHQRTNDPYGRYASDAGMRARLPAHPMNIDYDFLSVRHWKGPNLNPQVDHLIPRRDSKGCQCGTNDWTNALLISADLNQRMSNSCLHPDRLAILAKYTFAPNALGSDEPDVGSAAPSATMEEAEAAAEIGGCNAAGAIGAPLVGVAFLGLLRRRRRR